jgi:outer membrane protein assembly factor BamD
MFRNVLILVLFGTLAGNSGIFHHKKYDNPITKDTKQPDKVLFDKAINDIEHGRFEVARITLNTLINTYDQSEFLAKAKLAVADSWYREGGAHGLAQAEAEYKDFQLFYPMMTEAAESQMRICDIHYKQMDKADRDPSQALRTEDECREAVIKYPNSPFVPKAQQKLRDAQEALADAEMRVALFYHAKGSNPAAANRFARMVDQYPLYSAADEALWQLADSYSKMGGKDHRFKKEEIAAYSRIVRDYPLSGRAEDAKKKLTSMEAPIPDADQVALNRMKYDKEHPVKPGLFYKATELMRRGPDVSKADQIGAPAMTTLPGRTPLSVPPPPVPLGSAELTGGQVPEGSTALDKNEDARKALAEKPAETPAEPTAATNVPPPTNHTPLQLKKKLKKKKATEPAPAKPADPKATDTSAASK